MEGRVEASRALVSKQLQLKFGSLTSAQRALVDIADADALERWAERVLTATSVDDVVRPGGAR